jgi:hypothetical protein
MSDQRLMSSEERAAMLNKLKRLGIRTSLKRKFATLILTPSTGLKKQD